MDSVPSSSATGDSFGSATVGGSEEAPRTTALPQRPRVAVKTEGFTELAGGNAPVVESVPRVTCPRSKSKVLIAGHSIFIVHGLQGHPAKTWTTGAEDAQAKKEHRRWLSWVSSRRSPSAGSGESDRQDKDKDKNKDKTKEEEKEKPITDAFWPRDFLPNDFGNARIATYGYDSKISHWFGGPAHQNSIYDHGETLLNDLERFRRSSNTPTERKIIFIAHSLGGLIVKEVCNHCAG